MSIYFCSNDVNSVFSIDFHRSHSLGVFCLNIFIHFAPILKLFCYNVYISISNCRSNAKYETKKCSSKMCSWVLQGHAKCEKYKPVNDSIPKYLSYVIILGNMCKEWLCIDSPIRILSNWRLVTPTGTAMPRCSDSKHGFELEFESKHNITV